MASFNYTYECMPAMWKRDGCIGVCVCVHNRSLTQASGSDGAAGCRVNSPVVVFQVVHELQHGSHTPDGVVDCRRANKFGRQVRIQGQLHLKSKAQNDSFFHSPQTANFLIACFLMDLFLQINSFKRNQSVINVDLRLREQFTLCHVK